MNKENPILSVKNLTIGYPQKQVASDVNVEIYSGELTAVIGINGSGKSTFLNTLSGNLTPTTGEIFIQQQALPTLTPQRIAEHISLVLSNPVFSQNLTVYEMVALGRHPYTNWLGLLSQKDKEAINRAIKLIDLKNLAHRKCGELSDGQLQKAFIARALAQNTEVIILDEPTNHLDLYHKAFVFKLLKKLTQDTGKAVVLATHELNLALQLCDKLILISNGKVISGSPEKLIEDKTLHQLFPTDLIRFDEQTKSFQIVEARHPGL